MDYVPESFIKVTRFSKFVAIILFVFLPFLGFYFGMIYQMSQPPVDIVKVKAPETKTQNTSSIRAGNNAVFTSPEGWHVAIDYLDGDLDREVFFIHPSPWRFNYPSDSSPKVLMNVYTNKSNPKAFYDEIVDNFYAQHENITTTTISQKYFDKALHFKGIIKEPSVYAGGISEMYIMISSNPPEH